MIANSDCAVVVLCAASGYGKTTVVRHFTEAHAGSTVWVEGCGRSLDAAEVLGLLLRALCETFSGDLVMEFEIPLRPSVDEILAGIRQVVSATSCQDTLYIVLDDVGLAEGWLDAVEGLLASLQADVVVLVTSRSPVDHVPPHLDALVVTAPTLQFTEAEIGQLLKLSGTETNPETVSRLLAFTRGQAALLGLCIPYVLALDDSRELEEQWNQFASVRTYVKNVFERHLSPSLRPVLHAAALLGEGRVADLAFVIGREVTREIEAIAEAVPLVCSEPRGRFSVHSLAQEAILGTREMAWDDTDGPGHRILRLLASEGRLQRLLALADGWMTDSERRDCLDRYGCQLIDNGFLHSTLVCLESIPPALLLARPSVIFLMARVLDQLGRSEEAEAKAAAARSLASADEDQQLIGECLVFLSRRWLEAGREAQAFSSLADVRNVYWSSLNPDTRVLSLGLRAIAATIVGRREIREQCLEELSTSDKSGVSAEASGKALLYEGYVQVLLGDWNAAARTFRHALSVRPISLTTAVTIRGDLAATLLEMGRPKDASVMLTSVLDSCEALGLEGHQASFSSLSALIRGALTGDYVEAAHALLVSARRLEDCGEHFYAFQELLYLASVTRALGQVEESFSHCQACAEYYARQENLVYRVLANVETAASLTAFGDVHSARTLALESHDIACSNGYLIHALKAALVLAVCDLEDGDEAQAIERIRNQAVYLKSESSTWQLAMYVRAFPQLIGLLQAALRPASPPRRLRSLLPHSILQSSSGGASGSATSPRIAEITLFGSFSARTVIGHVQQGAWRKRKARVLFAMLAVKRGQDVPRDQILEHLWPEMDAERARNNFYVVWSAMKSALMGGADRTKSCPYVENSGGVCRIVSENVRTDLDDFDEQLDKARAAEAAGRNDEAIAAYTRLAELYRGDLLPSDLYDDWFTSTRDHYRHEFSAAMMQAARLEECQRRPDSALRFVRAALAFDPWREDLYQAAIRYQMSTGQRGAAIETYLACRTRLADDLGLDPSAETRGLYDEILAMEDDTVGAAAV